MILAGTKAVLWIHKGGAVDPQRRCCGSTKVVLWIHKGVDDATNETHLGPRARTVTIHRRPPVTTVIRHVDLVVLRLRTVVAVAINITIATIVVFRRACARE
jgi:hypothetical protein